ncbi:MAG: hypothetical protein ACQKBU_10630, partial [Verrucomicrobiales bacterium]
MNLDDGWSGGLSEWLLAAGRLSLFGGAIGLGTLPGEGGAAATLYSDPLVPPVAPSHLQDSEVSFFRIPARLKQIEKEIEAEAA